jgi:hypothetical protein
MVTCTDYPGNRDEGFFWLLSARWISPSVSWFYDESEFAKNAPEGALPLLGFDADGGWVFVEEMMQSTCRRKSFSQVARKKQASPTFVGCDRVPDLESS